MARTQAADYGQRRDAIVRQAAKLFAQEGFRGASVADLAEACAMSKSLIYHYYPSKEDILYAVMASHIDLLEQDVARTVAEGGPAAARLRTLLHRFMGHYVGAADRQKVLLNELDSLPPARRAAIVTKQRAIVDAVIDLLAGIEGERAEDRIHRRARAMLLFGMLNWTHTWYDPAGPIGPDALADMALAMVMREPAQAS